METFNDIFMDCTSLGTKIPKEEYLVNGKHIVVDQGQNAIAGYTDLETIYPYRCHTRAGVARSSRGEKSPPICGTGGETPRLACLL